MLEFVIGMIQLVVGWFILTFVAKWLNDRTHNPWFAAALIAVFLLIWTDLGGLAEISKMGLWPFLQSLFSSIFVYGLFLFIGVVLTTYDDTKQKRSKGH